MRSNPCLPLLAFASLLFASTLAAATAQRTFVASTGVDNVNCSLASPCRAFAAAITATTAGGEVIVLDSAGYGTVNITKAVSIIAPAGIYAGISVFSGDGIAVTAPGATVVLRGLTINGVGGSTGSGINLHQAARLRIESCVISKMGADGILHSAPNAEIVVLDTIVRDNGASGIGGDADAFVVLDHVRSEHNGTNGFYMSSLSAEARAMITDSIFAFNGTNGVWFGATGTGATSGQIERSVLADNGGAGLKGSASLNAFITTVLSRNAIHHNVGDGVSIILLGTGNAALSENTFRGNGGGINADGDLEVHASANNMAFNGSTFAAGAITNFLSYGNNTGTNITSGTISPHTGF